MPADEHIAEILLYANFLDELEAITLQFYHQTVDGAESQRDYRKAVRNAGRELWEQLNWPGEAPGFTNSAFVAEMEKRFKAIMSMFSANGYYGLHMGHVSLDDRRRIAQYDQSAEFRYIVRHHVVNCDIPEFCVLRNMIKAQNSGISQLTTWCLTAIPVGFGMVRLNREAGLPMMNPSCKCAVPIPQVR